MISLVFPSNQSFNGPYTSTAGSKRATDSESWGNLGYLGVADRDSEGAVQRAHGMKLGMDVGYCS